MIDYTTRRNQVFFINENESTYNSLLAEVNETCNKFIDSYWDSGKGISLQEMSDITLGWFRKMFDLYTSTPMYKTMVFIRMQQIISQYGDSIKKVFTSTNPAVTESDKKNIMMFKQVAMEESAFVSKANTLLKDLFI